MHPPWVSRRVGLWEAFGLKEPVVEQLQLAHAGGRVHRRAATACDVVRPPIGVGVIGGGGTGDRGRGRIDI